ncbi:MAG: UbiA family prenyltransferase, partial [Rhodospirillales bacterium]|nr:UbiA family prenyltransferase [Rhodospirillales bacterium]
MAPANSRPVSLLADLVALGRYDRPIGIWLLAWPCAWGVALARPASIDLAVLCVILLAGSALARAGGCAWNDLVDRDLDASVERTRNRPLAAGRIGPRAALAFIAAHLALAASLLALLPATAVWLGVPLDTSRGSLFDSRY